MAVEQRVFNIGFMEAAADLTAKQFYCVEVSAALKVNVNNAAGEHILGILQNKPNTGETADVSAVGVSKLKIGTGGLTAGVRWMADSDGRGVAATAAKVSGGIVLEGGSENEIATVLVNTNGATIPA